MQRSHLLVFLMLCSISIFAQDNVTEGKNRLNFAKTYFELGGQYSPTFAGKQIQGNSIRSFRNTSSVVPYLNIGGLHFWGHADFYIGIPLAQLNTNKTEYKSFQLNQSVVTGARLLPWSYTEGRVRPFVGTSWAVVNFKQGGKTDQQPMLSKNRLLLDAGLLYGKKNLMARVGVNYYPSNKWEYPLDQTSFQQLTTPQWSAYVGIIYAFETTRSRSMETENVRLNKYPRVSKPTMNAIKKGDYFFGFGPSSSFMLSKSVYNESAFPYFNKRPISTTYLDIAVGYQFNRAGMVTALSYRNPKFANEAFGTKQTISKKSLAFEVYKYLTDYSGFTPYLGLNVAYDQIEYREETSVHEELKSFSKLNPGITFGWDILPGKTEQWFVLRTNLRWYPFLNLDIKGMTFSQNQLEYNVIQAVFYPSRFKNAMSKKER